ncbi:hypothetical protein MUO79_04125 [Candidatus Bathyarchaeota archaeon]|nr:hypothetical protein [Candidatus Bathyarchaeota archaeon]
MKFEAIVKKSKADPRIERRLKRACHKIMMTEIRNKSKYYKHRSLRFGYAKKLGRVCAEDVPKAAIPELQKALGRYIKRTIKIKGHLHPWTIQKICKGEVTLKCADKDCEAKEVLCVSDGSGLARTLVHSYWRALDGKKLNRYSKTQKKKIQDFLHKNAKQIFQDAVKEIDEGIETSKAKLKSLDKEELVDPLRDDRKKIRGLTRMKKELAQAKLPLSS